MIDRSKNEPRLALLPAEEVAERLAVSVRTVYRMLKRGQLPPPIRFSRKLVRWRTFDIDRYLEALLQCRPSA